MVAVPRTRRRSLLAFALAAGAAVAPTALADGDHRASDTSAASPAQIAQAASAVQARALAQARVQAAVGPDAHLVGSWAGPKVWPLAPVHASMLTDGRVLAWENAPRVQNQPLSTPAMLWDPATEAITRVDTTTGYNIFCGGLAHLPDGRVFVAGGDLNSTTAGIPQTHTFTPATGTWALGVNMRAERWYPGVTPLANGEMLIAEGGPRIPEVRTTSGTLRALTNIDVQMAGRTFPWIQVAPNGRAIYVGPAQSMWSIDTAGAGSAQFVGQRDPNPRSYGSYAMFDVGKILVVGGDRPALATARVVDVNGATPTSTATGSMTAGRRQLNATVLPDGSVLATGGFSGGNDLVDVNAATRSAERWDPATGTWTTLASEATPRAYHSFAILLPDGRVLSAGGGSSCGECEQAGYIARNFDVFSPPYLFNADGSGTLAPRPSITAAPSNVGYGESVTITTPQAAGIQKVALIRVASVTHGANTEQRYIPLAFTRGAGAITITTPASGSVAPPGHYMLFVLDAAGVPSVASMIQVGGIGVSTPPPAPTLTTATPGAGRVTLAWSVVAGASGYTVEYAPAAGGASISVDAGIASGLAVTGLTNGVAYRFVVRARNGAGPGPASNALVATPVPPFGAPTLTAQSIGDGSVRLSWTAVPGATEYTVRRGTSPGVSTNIAVVAAATGTTVSGLVNGSTYYFAVAAGAGADLGPDSNEVSATPNVPPPAPVLNPPTAGDGQVTLSWTRVAGATGFVLRWGTSPGSAEFQQALGIVEVHTVPKLVNGTTYYFTLVATNAAGAGLPSIERGATPVAPAIVLGAPRLAAPVPGNGVVALRWSAVPGATGYVIRWSAGATGPYEWESVLGDVTSTEVGGLVNGGTYRFAVAAVRPGVIGPDSNVQIAAPAAPPVIPIPSLQAFVATSFIPRGTGRGLLGDYFANPHLRGRPAFSRTERIAFRWGSRSPGRGLPADGFSVRWTGMVEAPETGVYRLAGSGDDSVRVWIGARLVLDTTGRRSHSGGARLTLVAGRRYPIRVEYRDSAGPAGVQLRWRLPGRARESTLARSRLYAPGT